MLRIIAAATFTVGLSAPSVFATKFMDGASGHCLLCDLYGKVDKKSKRINNIRDSLASEKVVCNDDVVEQNGTVVAE